MWIARHTPENTIPIIENALNSVKEQYGDKQYKVARGIYVVGYCFGGKYALRLAARDDVTAVAIAHGPPSRNVFACVAGTDAGQEPWST